MEGEYDMTTRDIHVVLETAVEFLIRKERVARDDILRGSDVVENDVEREEGD